MSRSLLKVLSIIFWSTTTSIMMALWTTKIFHSIPSCAAFSTGTTSVSTNIAIRNTTSRRRITCSSSSRRRRSPYRHQHQHQHQVFQLKLASTRAAAASSNSVLSSSSYSLYSQATKDRIKGLDAVKEFSKLSTKMKTPPNELKIILSKRLAASTTATEDDSDSIAWTEKDEYLDWLLSGSTSSSNNNKKKTITNNKNNNRPMPPITSRNSRVLKDLSRSSSSSRSRSFGTKADTINTGEIASSTENENKQTFHTDIRFDDPTTIKLDSLLLKGVSDMGLTHMTEIQSKTFVAASVGNDVLGRARTGTGKTVAFLLPALQRLICDNNNGGKAAAYDPNSVGMLIVSPTRELASQIGEQAKKILKYHAPNASVQVMFGGTNMKTDVNRLSGRRGLPTVLVATPGRLLDHLRSTKLRDPNSNNIISFGKDIMRRKCNILVLDETDRLLDMGFRNEIEKILEFLPTSNNNSQKEYSSSSGEGRQTLLFSATIPKDLKSIMKKHMKSNYVEIDCVNDGDAASHTNESVQQTHIVLPTTSKSDIVTSVIDTVHYAVESHYNQNFHDDNATDNNDNDNSSTTAVVVPPKIVVFFPTARLVQFYAEIFQEITGGVSVNVVDHNNDNEYNTNNNSNKKMKSIKIQSWELHSKKSQGYRNRVSDEFRKATTGVLFTSDVSARGVDYPNVSHVIQFGMPESRDQYIHRLGRTGRAGMKGKGWLVLQDWESPFLNELKGVSIPINNKLQSRIIDGTEQEQDESDSTNTMVHELHRRVRGGDGVLSKSASAAYAAFLGYYKGQMKRMKIRNSEDLVRKANDFASSTGFVSGPPPLQKSTVSKMGLKGVVGLNISTGGGKTFGGGGGGRTGGGRGGGGGGRGRSEQSRDRGAGGGGGRDSVGRRFRQGQDR